MTEKKYVMATFQRRHLQTTDSTNRWLMENGVGEMVVTADFQTAGRGQGAHTWESERGKNLLFSVMVHPVWLPVTQQFLLSEAWALALRDALGEYTDGIEIKWPNDIYWHDRKISGTLIETRLSGGVLKDAVIGTGVNVNQRAFVSDAPNPVSLWQACGTEEDIDREVLLNSILRHFIGNFGLLGTMATARTGGEEEIQLRYHRSLYRRNGFHWYEDIEGKYGDDGDFGSVARKFEAEIVGVAPSGTLTLRTRNGELRHYEQREVRFV